MPHQQPQSDLAVVTRRRWRIVGQVQGVGFRPFVFRLACENHLTGFVNNNTEGVLLEAQGRSDHLDRFASMLESRKPALALIGAISCSTVPTRPGESGFRIEESGADPAAQADVTVDTALCRDCLAELLDQRDRRSQYGLINCTNCGPRYTILRRVPYDRPNTTMAGFPMCAACHAEYTNPADRRFHAQPVACHACGPKVSLADANGASIEGDPIGGAAQRLMAGQVLAVKGLGGFHLAVRADDPGAVTRLRKLKHRDQKPFALMCRDLAAARNLVFLSDQAAELLLSPACPIVLAPRRPGAAVAEDVAPGNHRLGVMLAYTPMQHLLFHWRGGALGPLVMTSGNLSDEPLVIDNAEAVQRLGGMCDAILWHDRPIERAVDDSVLIDMADGRPLPIRRARGYVPASLAIPMAGQSMGLCVGGELKNTVAVVRGGRAVLSHHMGDLTHTLAYEYFRRAVDDMCDLFGVRPQWIAHDLHPAYLSTAWATELARKLDVPLVGVQHHHAHAAAVMAEHGQVQPALAVVCDGVGYGADGTMWGGELLRVDLKAYERLAHLKPMLLPGGDAAAHDGRRCALALLYQAFGDGFSEHPLAKTLVSDDTERAMLTAMIRKGLRCVPSSGAGRYFDGVAALLGVCMRNSFEAQAPMRLESVAAAAPWRSDQDLFALEGDDVMRIDLSSLIRALVARAKAGWDVAELAACFHDQFVKAWEAAVALFVETTGLNVVALSGGVFCNERLTGGLTDRLQRRGLRVLRHELVPPNDGGLSFGQAAAAAARAADREFHRRGA
jgi:hydrogenase maturation protein HypF